MVIGPLRIRRDNNQLDKSRKFVPEIAEPFFNTVDRRLRMGDGDAAGGRQPIPSPTSKGDQINTLWTSSYYGGGSPARITPLVTPRPMDVQSAMLPKYALADGGCITIKGRGLYQCRSHNPRIQILPVLESFDGSRIELRPHNSPSGANGFEVSAQTMGYNALGGFDQDWFVWSFEINIHGRTGGLNGANGAVADNLAIDGHIEVSEFLDGADGGGSQPRTTRGQGWTQINVFPYDRGQLRILGDLPYRAIFKHEAPANEPSDLATMLTAFSFSNTSRPGEGTRYPEYWHRRVARHRIQTTAAADVNQLNALHLMLGGATRTPGNLTILPHLPNPGTGGGSYPAFWNVETTDAICSNNSRFFVSRRPHPLSGDPLSLPPGVDGGGGEAAEGWHRDWRELTGEWADEMHLTHTHAIAIGGRPGYSTRTFF